MRASLVVSRGLACSVLALVGALGAACDGCGTRAVTEDAGTEGEGEGAAQDAGPHDDAGTVHDAGTPSDAGTVDAGDTRDAGNGFDLGSLLDGGIDGLQCLPTQLPTLTVAGALDALGLGLYAGQRETGVRCGVDPRVTCAASVPCCVLCGAAGCAGDGDGGTPVCPIFTQAYHCDDDGDCSGSDICCFTLQGTECRAAADCAFDVTGAVGQLIDAADGGFHLRDGGFLDGGFEDGGFTETFIDGGLLPDGGIIDGGTLEVPVQGPPGPVPDAGSILDTLQTTLDQGVPVCTSTLRDCDLLGGEACCTSDRLVAVDVGFCMPALLCLGGLLP